MSTDQRTTEEIQAEVAMLPFGPNGRQTVAFLMRSQNLSLTDAVIELERLAEASGTAYQDVRRQNRTGVRKTP